MKVFNKKVAIIGTGFVGTSIAYSMINQGIANELILVDIDKAKSEGEAIDLLDGVSWGQENVNVWAGDYQDCQDADIVVITAGANQKPGQSRLDLVSINAEIMKTIVNNIMKSGFDGILVIASNPVDVLDLCGLASFWFTCFKSNWNWYNFGHNSFPQRTVSTFSD